MSLLVTKFCLLRTFFIFILPDDSSLIAPATPHASSSSSSNPNELGLQKVSFTGPAGTAASVHAVFSDSTEYIYRWVWFDCVMNVNGARMNFVFQRDLQFLMTYF